MRPPNAPNKYAAIVASGEPSKIDDQPILIDPRDVDSSPDLIQRVGNFVNLAERVVASPLFGATPPTLTATLTFDAATGAAVGADISVAGQNPDEWELLLTRERAMVFNEEDPVHITQLASAIGREHLGLRAATRALGRRYHVWKATPLFGVRRLGPTAPEDVPAVGNVQALVIAPVAELAPRLDFDSMTSDLSLAQLYANSQLWHADSDKTATWNGMPEALKDLARKAAEARAISGAGLVHVAVEFIRSCRRHGYDF